MLLRLLRLPVGRRLFSKTVSHDSSKVLVASETLTSRKHRRPGIDTPATTMPTSSVENAPPFSLAPKPLAHSFCGSILPFSRDDSLRETYLNPYGDVRIGLLLEDLDSFAGRVAYRWTDGFNPHRPATIVTASCESIRLHRPVPISEDLVFRGRIHSVGRSSMQIDVTVSAIEPSTTASLFSHNDDNGGGSGDDNDVSTALETETLPGEEAVLQARFVMVALDPNSRQSIPVPSILEEEHPHADADAHAPSSSETESSATTHATTHASTTTRIRKVMPPPAWEVPPTPSEMASFHKLARPPDATTLMTGRTTTHQKHGNDPTEMPALTVAACRRTSLSVTVPTNRNIHGKVFGGFLMRLAFELAFASVYSLSAGARPMFATLDETIFTKPVGIGSVLTLTSSVHAPVLGQYAVQVVVEVANKEDAMQPEITNTFLFTFGSEAPIIPVLPSTYADLLARTDIERKLTYYAEGRG
jgi:acyl-coenzyme A thioesterase 9